MVFALWCSSDGHPGTAPRQLFGQGSRGGVPAPRLKVCFLSPSLACSIFYLRVTSALLPTLPRPQRVLCQDCLTSLSFSIPSYTRGTSSSRCLLGPVCRLSDMMWISLMAHANFSAAGP